MTLPTQNAGGMASTWRRPRVLLVEDEDAFRDVIEMTLQSAGYDVVAAPDGQVAHQLLGTNRYAAIVTDVCMPGMDGLELLTALRGASHPPIIAMSGGVDGETGYVLRMARLLGARCILRKPFPLGELLSALEELCPR